MYQAINVQSKYIFSPYFVFGISFRVSSLPALSCDLDVSYWCAILQTTFIDMLQQFDKMILLNYTLCDSYNISISVRWRVSLLGGCDISVITCFWLVTLNSIGSLSLDDQKYAVVVGCWFAKSKFDLVWHCIIYSSYCSYSVAFCLVCVPRECLDPS